MAALNPERIAFPAAFVLAPLLRLIYPLVWVINLMANGLLRLVGVSVKVRPAEKISPEELKVILMEAGVLMPKSHQEMLLAILELEKIAVEDIMLPRGQIEGVNLEADWDEIVSQIATSHHSRLPVYRGGMEHVVGILHLRKVIYLMNSGTFSRESLMQSLVEPYFIPKGTTLTTQLLNFKHAHRRTGLVVNEYGDVLGLVTLQDALEEIVGEFATRNRALGQDIQSQPDGSFLVNGGINLRDLNRRLSWKLPTDGPKTLNGLITEHLEDIPEAGTSLRLNGYQIEIVRTRGTAVQSARVVPPPETEPEPADEEEG